MEKISSKYEQIIDRFVEWAEGEEGIRAAIVVGSRARDDADEWADLDIMVVTTDPERILSEEDWLKNIGGPVITFTEIMPNEEDMERRVLFDNGLDVDFAIIPLQKVQMLHQMTLRGEIDPETAIGLGNAFGRGMRMILDKDDLAGALEKLVKIVGKSSPPPPSHREIMNVINDFWYHTVWTAKHLRRGELWWAKGCCDMHLKWLLRRMMEWHARTEGRDTWFRGRFLEKWADPRAVKDLRNSFAHYDEEDIWRALLSTMDLFRRIALETTGRLSYEYPARADEYATELVREFFAGRSC